MFRGALFATDKNGKQPKCPSMGNSQANGGLLMRGRAWIHISNLFISD